MCPEELIFNVEINGQQHHIEVSSPTGSGGEHYHIMIDRYYNGAIVSRPWGLHPYVHKDCILNSDDLQVILDHLTTKI